MKELFQKLSQISQSFKENRLVYEEKGRERKELTEAERDLAEQERTDAEFEALMRGEEKPTKKGEEKPTKKSAARLKQLERKKLREKEKEAKMKDKEEEREKEKKIDATRINEALDYAEELMNEVSRVGKIKYKLEFVPQKTKFSLNHRIDMFRVYADSELSDEDINKKTTKVCEFITEIQSEMFDKEVKSEKWQKISKKVYRKQARRYFKQLNKPLNKLSKKQRKEFLVRLIAFLKYDVAYAENFVSELLKSPPRHARKVIAKYSKPIPVEVAADVE